jgi:two-component system, LytTR family, sensor kinase
MKSLMVLNKWQIRSHIFFWVLIIVDLNIKGPIPGTLFAQIVTSGLICLNYMSVFYCISLVIFPKFWEQEPKMILPCILICLIIYWIFFHIIVCNIILVFRIPSNYQIKPLTYFLKNTFYYFVIDCTAGIASFFSRYSFLKLKEQNEKEKILITKELNLLKNTFNSELTFDFLKYCHHNTINESPDVAEALELFSDMLHYTIQTKPDEKANLKNEIEYIQNFINLQNF